MMSLIIWMQEFRNCAYNAQQSIVLTQESKTNLVYKHIDFYGWAIYKLFSESFLSTNNAGLTRNSCIYLCVCKYVD